MYSTSWLLGYSGWSQLMKIDSGEDGTASSPRTAVGAANDYY